MTTMTIENSLAKRLKAATNDVHEGVDRSIMSAASFATRERYAGFLAVQYLFHRDVDALYGDARLLALLPDLAERRRLPLVEADLADLGVSRPIADEAPVFAADDTMDLPTALGWLYVAEGSNMGAALLRKEAAKIGLSDNFGARHLAPAPEGPAPHWRAFVAGLDAVSLTQEDESRAVAGARDAFARVQAHVDARIG
ncbi:biliverdin-producing heme oxygenase [Novosphingobium sp. M1R2S20]|uniref:Biliverdin-producing heme oxygenase n=1 Tax=Novosphingobium rhizovicinum TaxID=3228928 RepID=A0ABV3R955_9SPHN